MQLVFCRIDQDTQPSCKFMPPPKKTSYKYSVDKKPNNIQLLKHYCKYSSTLIMLRICSKISCQQYHHKWPNNAQTYGAIAGNPCKLQLAYWTSHFKSEDLVILNNKIICLIICLICSKTCLTRFTVHVLLLALTRLNWILLQFLSYIKPRNSSQIKKVYMFKNILLTFKAFLQFYSINACENCSLNHKTGKMVLSQA